MLQQSSGGHLKDTIESPAVLVIRSKKHSLDEGEQKGESSQILEAETYKMMRSNQGKPEWTKETLLKERHSKQPNRRGLYTINRFNSRAGTRYQQQQQLIITPEEPGSDHPREPSPDLVEDMVYYYNSLNAHVNNQKPAGILK